jgi:hypothetical protein
MRGWRLKQKQDRQTRDQRTKHMLIERVHNGNIDIEKYRGILHLIFIKADQPEQEQELEPLIGKPAPK